MSKQYFMRRQYFNPVLRHLRASYYRKVEEYEKKINDSGALANIARKSKDSSKVEGFRQRTHLTPNRYLGISVLLPNSEHIGRQ
jgi:hypothetical protein